jgi:NADH-quinone oxidoreductase subunit C
MSLSRLKDHLPELLGASLLSLSEEFGELTCEIDYSEIKSTCQKLKDHGDTQFEILIDLCGMDYSSYGNEESVSMDQEGSWKGRRYAVVYHLLSLTHNARLRLRAELDEDQPTIESVIDVWPTANWFEREAFDLIGIMFTGHPDLRRILTDYGFIGHPFRKDFPLSGQVEMRYDEEQGRVIYQPVTVEERILVPRTIRKDTFVKTAGNKISGKETSD